MATANFKNYASNKMFIAVFYKGGETPESGFDGDQLNDNFEAIRNELLGDHAELITLNTGYYEGASIGINYNELLDMFDHNGEGATKRKALRIKLELALQKIYEELKYLYENIFDITGMSRGASFSNGETMYNEHKEGKEEI